MKRNLTAVGLAFAVLMASGGAAQATQVVDLSSSPIVREVSNTSGSAYVDLKYGVVKIKAKNFPKDADTGLRLPSTLTDASTRPADVRDAGSYQAWLLRVEKVNGVYMIPDGLFLGSIKVAVNGTGALSFRSNTNLTGEGFNLVAVTAEEVGVATKDIGGGHDWVGESAAQSFTWRGSNSVIILWGALAPLP